MLEMKRLQNGITIMLFTNIDNKNMSNHVTKIIKLLEVYH